MANNQFHIQQRYPANVVNNYKIIIWEKVNDHRLFPFYHNDVASGDEITPCNKIDKPLLFDFINLTQVHNFTVSAQDIFTFRRLSAFTVSFTGILQVLMR